MGKTNRWFNWVFAYACTPIRAERVLIFLIIECNVYTRYAKLSQEFMIQFIRLSASWHLTCAFLLKVFFLAFSIGASIGASAQDFAQDSGQLDRIYSANSKLRIEGFSATAPYRLIGADSSWNYIKFESSVVPVWVKSTDIGIQNDRATVLVDDLNARISPVPNASIVTIINRGYVSKVLASKSGFTRILAPQDTVVALKKQDVFASANQATQIKSEESLDTTKTVESVAQKSVETDNSTVAAEPQSGTQSQSESVIARNNSPATSSVPRASTEHFIAPGDSISLTVFGEGDLSREDLRVAENGQVSFPLLGAMNVSGMNTTQIEVEVQKRLATGYVKNPKVSVSMFSYRPIFIRGAVRNIGAYPYAQGLTVGKAIALAGGVSSSAQSDGVTVERNGEVQIEGLSVDSQYSIESGDVISVEDGFGQSSMSESYIYLHGEVNNPGEYKFRRGLTVEKAVVLAGGFSMRASKRKISVTRYSAEQEQPEVISKAELYLSIEPGDVIRVGASWF
jgi:polysaccharide export outer membrane protein